MVHHETRRVNLIANPNLLSRGLLVHLRAVLSKVPAKAIAKVPSRALAKALSRVPAKAHNRVQTRALLLRVPVNRVIVKALTQEVSASHSHLANLLNHRYRARTSQACSYRLSRRASLDTANVTYSLAPAEMLLSISKYTKSRDARNCLRIARFVSQPPAIAV